MTNRLPERNILPWAVCSFPNPVHQFCRYSSTRLKLKHFIHNNLLSLISSFLFLMHSCLFQSKLCFFPFKFSLEIIWDKGHSCLKWWCWKLYLSSVEVAFKLPKQIAMLFLSQQGISLPSYKDHWSSIIALRSDICFQQSRFLIYPAIIYDIPMREIVKVTLVG